jgi:hypothetical protein
MAEGNTRWEEMRVTGDQLMSTVKSLVREGNIRRIVIKNAQGRVYLEIPLTIGAVGAVLMPVLAAIGAVAAVASGLTIAVERIVPPDGGAGSGPSGATGGTGGTGSGATGGTGSGTQGMTGASGAEPPRDPTGDDVPG